MKQFLLIALATVAMCLTSCAQTPKNMKQEKVLVAYYSATGTTEGVAKLIAEATGGTLCEIQPEQAYTSADLDWTDKTSRSTKEMADAKSRPAIVKNLKDAESYDVIYIGFPIWWDEAPRVVNTFLESYDFAGKTVIPFATSGGSSISNSERVLKATYPKLKWQSGRLLNRATSTTVANWLGK